MYSISFKHTAAQEYKDAIDWYSERSKPAAQKFTQAIEDKLYQLDIKNTLKIIDIKFPATD